MASPNLVDVEGTGIYAKTWVAEITFNEPLTDIHKANILTHIGEKPFTFGVYHHTGPKYLVVIRCTNESGSMTNCNCKTMLLTLFKRAHVEVMVGQLAAFNGYHAELFGFKSVPHLVQEPKSTVVETTDLEEEEIGELTTGANNMTDFSRICTDYFAKREHDALALRSDPSESTDNPLVIHLQWLTTPPTQIEVVTKRSLRESQKLEWVLFRDRAIHGDDSMTKAPNAHHWHGFYSLYTEISQVGDTKNMIC